MLDKQLYDSLAPLLKSIEDMYREIPDGIQIGTSSQKLEGAQVERNGTEMIIKFWDINAKYKLIIDEY